MKKFLGWIKYNSLGPGWTSCLLCDADSIDDARAIFESEKGKGFNDRVLSSVVKIEEVSSDTKRFVFTDRLSGEVISEEMAIDEVVRETLVKFQTFKEARIMQLVHNMGIGHKLSWFNIVRVA